MSLKAKIISKLKAKATELGANLSNVRINGLADKLDGLITSEDDIDGEIDKLDQVFSFKEMASLDDAKRNAEKKSTEEEEADKAKKEAEEKSAAEAAKGGTGGEIPDWFKAHTESQNKILEGLTSQLANIQKGSLTQTRRQQLEAKLKDAPDRFKTQTLRYFDRLKLESDEEFTSYLAEVEQDVADEIQAASDAGLGNDSPYRSAGGGKLKDDEVSPEMKEIVAQREAEAKAKAGA